MLIASQLSKDELIELLEQFWPLKHNNEDEGTNEQLIEDLENELLEHNADV